MIPAAIGRNLIASSTLALHLVATGCAQTLSIREGFEETSPEKWALRPCIRPENQFSADALSISGTRSARLEASHTRAKLSPRLTKHCTNDPGNDYDPEDAERAELWERAEARLDVKADAWYGFSMRIDGPVSLNEPRLVIGQWKQTASGAGRSSPILAQRFTGHNFHITIEQDGPNGQGCRILVASQRGLPPPTEDIGLHKFLLAEDKFTTSRLPPCGKNVVIQGEKTTGSPPVLPNPFHACWIDMVFHMARLGTNDGLLEIWANGKKVVTVKGQIGYAAHAERYFKFGPYRNAIDPHPDATVAHIDNFSRGGSYAEVDPTKFPGRKAAAMCQ